MKSDASGIAVFGSSEPQPGEELYEQAYRLGELLAASGYRVINGGYGGVMEAASRGAREAGGQTLGVACSIFSWRRPNPFLTEVIEAPDLFARTRELVQRARGFVVLQGKSGTLAELAFLWALHRAGCLERRPVVLLGGGWHGLLRCLEAEGVLESSQLSVTRVVESPEAAVELLNGELEPS
jgi:uncharacterized protein (TIGR00730 family)